MTESEQKKEITSKECIVSGKVILLRGTVRVYQEDYLSNAEEVNPH